MYNTPCRASTVSVMLATTLTVCILFQAADCLDDHESLSDLSRLLYQQLFSPLTLHGQIRVHEKLAQV